MDKPMWNFLVDQVDGVHHYQASNIRHLRRTMGGKGNYRHRYLLVTQAPLTPDQIAEKAKAAGLKYSTHSPTQVPDHPDVLAEAAKAKARSSVAMTREESWAAQTARAEAIAAGK